MKTPMKMASSLGMEAEPQVLRFRDAKTDVNVILIGTMHYNPVSIEKVERIIDEHKADDTLRAVVIESCPKRWNVSTRAARKAWRDGKEKKKKGDSPLKRLLYNEMIAAADSVQSVRETVPLVLGDARIEDIGNRVRELGFATLKQATDFPRGWIEVWKELSQALQRAALVGEETLAGRRLGPEDFLELRLMLASPISLTRYCAAILIKGPNALRFPLLLMVGLFFFNPDASTASDAIVNAGAVSDAAFAAAAATAVPEPSFLQAAEDLLGSTLFALVETVLLGRIFLVGLLEERNVVLARNIREACRAKHKDEGFVDKLLGSSRTNQRSTVIAVLGMAHCNGVQQLLTSGEVDLELD
mmetsp:Transcript_6437/g.18202  ORF Transcript_6437/g.18202 Transcript_6437/m.18202 type:complete len:358 (+) Transcript_6437:128-1201(+)